MSDTNRKKALSRNARKNKLVTVITKDVPTGIEDLNYEQHLAIDGNTKIKGCKTPIQIIVKQKNKSTL